jgi:hypothetical protein
MDFQSFGKLLVLLALALGILGLLLWLGGALGLGRLPGDIRFQRGGWSCFIPIVSSIILSIVLTLLLNLLLRLIGR